MRSALRIPGDASGKRRGEPYTARVQQVFSHSSLSYFENCPSNTTSATSKVEVDTEGIEAFVGKRVHEVLERLYLFAGARLLPSLAR